MSGAVCRRAGHCAAVGARDVTRGETSDAVCRRDMTRGESSDAVCRRDMTRGESSDAVCRRDMTRGESSDAVCRRDMTRGESSDAVCRRDMTRGESSDAVCRRDMTRGESSDAVCRRDMTRGESSDAVCRRDMTRGESSDAVCRRDMTRGESSDAVCRRDMTRGESSDAVCRRDLTRGATSPDAGCGRGLTGAASPAAVSRHGLARGARSRPFAAADLLRAALDLSTPTTVYVEADAAGVVSCGAAAAVRAARAPHVAACDAVLGRAGAGDVTLLRMRLVRAVPPLTELRVWFDEDLLAALEMPFLTLRNIRGRRDYECHECSARFEEPNPLKVHLFLRCAPFAAELFWREVCSRLEPAAAMEPVEARLEALAAEWGRARGGHACLYCGKLYSRKYGLKIHIRTHTGYRPLRCRHCARAFGDPSNLNKHVRLHAASAAPSRRRAPP